MYLNFLCFFKFFVFYSNWITPSGRGLVKSNLIRFRQFILKILFSSFNLFFSLLLPVFILILGIVVSVINLIINRILAHLFAD